MANNKGMLVRAAVGCTDLSLFTCCEFQRTLHPPLPMDRERGLSFSCQMLTSHLMRTWRRPFFLTGIWKPSFLLTSIDKETWRTGEAGKKFRLATGTGVVGGIYLAGWGMGQVSLGGWECSGLQCGKEWEQARFSAGPGSVLFTQLPSLCIYLHCLCTPTSVLFSPGPIPWGFFF